MNSKKIFQVKNLSFSYDNSHRKILNNCNFSVEQGEMLSILGPNGAGKSTLLNCLCNIIKPQSGEILLYNTPIGKKSAKEIAQLVGYVQQKYTPTFAYTVLDYVLMGTASTINFLNSPKSQDKKRANQALSLLNISHLSNKFITELSGGEFQQVTIAQVILQNPKIIIFDEPTAHLDYGKQILTLRLIKQMLQQGYSVIMTTHNPDHVLLLGGNVAILDEHGSLTFGTVNNILTENRLEKLYNIPLNLIDVEEVSRTICVLPNL